MDMFKTFDDYEVDLDDMDSHPEEFRTMNVYELFSTCMNKAGSSLFYMEFLHKEFGTGGQKERVEVLCKELAEIWHNRRIFDKDNKKKCILINESEYRLLLLKWFYRFEDEVENQC